ncbi:Uncharacterised protein [Mycobacteroides abscessus subsp. abscessus]|nr:Uncharacterised protein [Mycobacteroides abscessus subsp. abscessus]SII12621.1 Uncharacterised protein [Mycobacteroides abscessus subsp. abscessus]
MCSDARPFPLSVRTALRLIEGRRLGQPKSGEACEPAERLLNGELRSAIAKATLAFQEPTEPQNGRLVEPLRDELDPDRQTLGAEPVGHRKCRQSSQIEWSRRTHDVGPWHCGPVDCKCLRAMRCGGHRIYRAEEHVEPAEVPSERRPQRLHLRPSGVELGERRVFHRNHLRADRGQLTLPPDGQVLDVWGQLTVDERKQRRRGVGVVEERRRDLLHVAPQGSQL